MTIPPDVKVTTELLWQATLIVAPFDAIFVAVLVWRLKPLRFRQLKWTLTVTMGVFFCAIWGILASYYFWEPVYHYVFPEWARWFLPPAYGLLFAAISLLCWWLALRLPGNAVLHFCLLGGFWGMATHAWAIQRGLLDRPPMLQGASPVAVVVFPAFEFIFYWCVGLTVSVLLQGAWERLTGTARVLSP